jgi:nucleotide-binding universal stress UspA family protein
MNATGAHLGGILCGVDGSAHARHAASAALALADRLGTRLTLVHVAPIRTLVRVASLPADHAPSDYAHSTEVAEAQAEEAFASLSSEVSRAEVDRDVRLGDPATVLAELAEERGTEIIVVGSRGRGAWRSAALGSVSTELARLAPCPVLIVPEHTLVELRTG